MDPELLTYDDLPGYEQQYDAFVLYAEQDWDFVNEMTQRLTSEGFQICTKDKLLPAGGAVFAAVAKLISERCQRIILVISPEFLDSPDYMFFEDYAQAIDIGTGSRKIIPVRYRACPLPPPLSLYHALRYDSARVDFWTKLALIFRTSLTRQSTSSVTTVTAAADL